MNQTNSRAKVESIAMLRGLAIICIVGEHAAFAIWPHRDTEGILNLLFTQFIPRWTAIFVFISGYLFYYLSFKYQTRKYYLTKLRNVVVPYLLISAISYVYLAQGALSQLTFGWSDPTHNIFVWLVTNLFYGSINTPLWFIPMICCIFLLGPWLYRMSRENLVFVSLICLIFINYYHRPPYQEGPLLNAIFFIAYYIIGMCVCQHKDWVIEKAWRHFFPLLCLTLFPCVVSLLKFYHFQIYSWISYDDNLQIFLLGLIAFVLMEKLSWPQWLKTLLIRVGETSFATFFIHYLFIHAMYQGLIAHPAVSLGLINHNSGSATFVLYTVVWIITLVLCHFTAVILKRMLGKRSRSLIGY